MNLTEVKVLGDLVKKFGLKEMLMKCVELEYQNREEKVFIYKEDEWNEKKGMHKHKL